jgi:hypothetical protein
METIKSLSAVFAIIACTAFAYYFMRSLVYFIESLKKK